MRHVPKQHRPVGFEGRRSGMGDVQNRRRELKTLALDHFTGRNPPMIFQNITVLGGYWRGILFAGR